MLSFRPASYLAVSVILATAPACQSDGHPDLPADEGGLFGETVGDDEGASGEAGETGQDPAPQGTPARHVSVSRVVVNQAVQIPVGENGAGVGPEGRNASVIAERPTMIRAYVEPSAEFTPRELEARLRIHPAPGEPGSPLETIEVNQIKLIEGASSDADLDSTFRWVLPVEYVQPGVEYSVELFELEGAAEAQLPEEAVFGHRLPHEGTAAIGVEAGEHRLRVAIVPVTHNYGGCSTTPSVSDGHLEELAQLLENYYPVEAAEVMLAPGMTYSASIGSNADFSGLLTAISQRRSADNPDPDVFYYGVVDSCDGLPSGGVVGQAFGIPDAADPGLAYARVTVGRWGGSPSVSGPTFIHELGHAHGRYHVHCNGTEGAPDNQYPYNQGIIGVWGWAIHGGGHFGPAGARDFMTYCGPYWVSDYGWRLLEPFIRISSSWVGQQLPPQQDIVVGHVDPDGKVQTFRTRGGLPGQPDGVAEDGLQGIALWTMERPDSDATVFVAPAESWPQAWTTGQALDVELPQRGRIHVSL